MERGGAYMLKNLKLTTSIIMLSSLLVLVAGCGSKKANDSKKEISVALNSELSSVDVSLAMDNTSSDVMEQVGEGLYDFTAKGGVKPALATNKPKATDHGKKYVFNLRKDAKWSNGKPVTAKDFVYSWRRTVDPKTKSPQSYYFDGVKNYQAIANGKKAPSSLGIKANGKYKLEVTLDRAMPYFPSILAVSASFPLYQPYVEKQGKKYGTDAEHTLYNGAFTLKGWNGSNGEWSYVKNKDYWNAKHVQLDKVNVKVYKTEQTMVQQYQAKKIQFTQISGSTVKNLKKDQDLTVRKIPGNQYLVFNVKENKLFANQKVRQALAMAVDSNKLTKHVLQDQSLPATGYVPYGFNNSKTGKDFAKQAGQLVQNNKTKAQKLWAEGLKELGMTSAEFSILSSNTETAKQVDEYLQSQFETTFKNLKVRVAAVPFNSRLSKQNSGDFDTVLSGWTPVYADPTDFLNLLMTNNNNNNGKWSNSEYDQLIKDANDKYALDEQKRWDNMEAANKIAVEQAPIAPLFYISQVYLKDPNLKGMMLGPLGQPYYKDASYK